MIIAIVVIVVLIVLRVKRNKAPLPRRLTVMNQNIQQRISRKFGGSRKFDTEAPPAYKSGMVSNRLKFQSLIFPRFSKGVQWSIANRNRYPARLQSDDECGVCDWTEAARQ